MVKNLESGLKLNRNYGYDILINTFEPVLRNYIANEVFLISHGNDWKKHIPKGVITDVTQNKEDLVFEDCSIDDFFEEITFLNLKDILVFSNNFKLAKSFFGALSKAKFTKRMDELNIYRRKIAHARTAFSNLDLQNVIEYVELLCQGDTAKEVKIYLQNEEYKKAQDVPLDFFEEYECQNNLPPENYNLDGGFVGRENEIRTLRKLIKSNQDRINTITGAGGVGKTAIALRVAYSFLSDPQNPFDAIIWFSAKTSKLTDEGIVPLAPGITSNEQLMTDLLGMLDLQTLQKFKDAKVPLVSYRNYLYKLFSSQKCLCIIDNLETIIRDDAVINFVKDIPRQSQVIITSRKGLGEIERRYPLTDMSEKDAIQLFRIIAKERNRKDLLSLKEDTISKLVKRVKCYPLLIKWSIGQVCIGKDLDSAFSEIFAGESEIAKFSFNDVFLLLPENAKLLLYGMIIYGEKPVSKSVLMHLANLTEDQFEDAIKELMITSFVFSESKEEESRISTEYSMLSLTRGFVDSKLDEDEKTKEMLLTRFYHLSEQIREYEKSKSSYSQSLFRLGIKNSEEKVAFTYVKSAKNYYKNEDTKLAEENFENAIKIAPNFSYALAEYSKFEFHRGHIPKALGLAEKAVKVNPENFHPWFSYGIMLRRNQNFPEAIKILQKAKELNPKHLPIYNELGRVYTFIGDYEKAEIEFEAALTEEKYPNYRHKMMTLQFLADNYKRWAEAFRLRHDSVGDIGMLEKALKTIKEALEINQKDRKLLSTYWKICASMGITLRNEKGFAEGKPYLETCLQPMKVGETLINPDSETVAEACFYLAIFSMRESDRNLKQIEIYINKGLANCMDGSKIFHKLNSLKQQLFQNGTPRIEMDDRRYGRIKYFNTGRHFGIIETATVTYLFFISGFRQRVSPELELNLGGRTVSFVLTKNPTRENSMIATDIVFEES